MLSVKIKLTLKYINVCVREIKIYIYINFPSLSSFYSIGLSILSNYNTRAVFVKKKKTKNTSARSLMELPMNL